MITESLVICRYLDEVGQGPSMFGGSPAERAVIGMWERRAELRLFIPCVEYGHHARPENAADFVQSAEFAESQKAIVRDFLPLMGQQLERARRRAAAAAAAASAAPAVQADSASTAA